MSDCILTFARLQKISDLYLSFIHFIFIYSGLGELSDKEIQNADLMELAITKLQEKIVRYLVFTTKCHSSSGFIVVFRISQSYHLFLSIDFLLLGFFLYFGNQCKTFSNHQKNIFKEKVCLGTDMQ